MVPTQQEGSPNRARTWVLSPWGAPQPPHPGSRVSPHTALGAQNHKWGVVTPPTHPMNLSLRGDQQLLPPPPPGCSQPRGIYPPGSSWQPPGRGTGVWRRGDSKEG